MAAQNELIFWTAAATLALVLIQLAIAIYFYGRLVERVDNLREEVTRLISRMDRAEWQAQAYKPGRADR